MDVVLVSVCVATHNHHRFIENCLSSVLAQLTDVSLEVLVGDDASVDDTASLVSRIADQHPGVVTLYRHPKNLGASANYQFLVTKASGRFIAHLDGDDYWLPGKLKQQLAHFVARPDCAGVYANAVVISESGSLVGVFNNEQPVSFDSNYLLGRGNFLHHGTLLYPQRLKSVVLSIKTAFIDYQIHLRLSEHGDLGYVNSVLAAYRIGHPGTMTGSSPNHVFELYWQAIAESVGQRSQSVETKKALRYFWASAWVRHVISRLPPSPDQALAMIRAQSVSFSALDIAAAGIDVCRIAWGLACSRLSRAISGESFRVLHRR